MSPISRSRSVDLCNEWLPPTKRRGRFGHHRNAAARHPLLTGPSSSSGFALLSQGRFTIDDMKRVSAHDVAAEIRSRLSNPGVVKVHKLLYYCQAWHVVSTGEPLFTEDIQAWANGPVVADFWHDEDKHRNPPPARSLDSEGLATIAYVITRYGHLSGADLIRLTHNEAPRLDASVAFGTGLRQVDGLAATHRPTKKMGR